MPFQFLLTGCDWHKQEAWCCLGTHQAEDGWVRCGTQRNTVTASTTGWMFTMLKAWQYVHRKRSDGMKQKMDKYEAECNMVMVSSTGWLLTMLTHKQILSCALDILHSEDALIDVDDFCLVCRMQAVRFQAAECMIVIFYFRWVELCAVSSFVRTCRTQALCFLRNVQWCEYFCHCGVVDMAMGARRFVALCSEGGEWFGISYTMNQKIWATDSDSPL